jgi:tetratricopeptide (TPR) repeat protein
MTSPSFVRRVRANSAYWLSVVGAVKDREYRSLDAEWHNFLQAIEFGLEHEDALAETAELWKALIGFVESRGYFGTWQPVTKRVAEKVNALPPELACRVANEVGFFLENGNDFDLAHQMHAAAMEAAEAAGDAFEQALAILGFGNVQYSLRRYDEAEASTRAALDLLDELDEGRLRYSGGLTLFGLIAFNRGDYAEAERRFEQAARGYLNAGHRRKAVNSISLVARTQDLAGDQHGAIATLEAALELLIPGIDLITWTDVYNNLGTAYFHLGDYARATEAFLAIDQERLEKYGLLRPLMHTTNNLGNVALKEEAWEAARDYLVYSIGLARRLEMGIDLGNSLGDLAEVLLNLGEREAARTALDEAVTALEGYPENAWARKRLAAILAQRKEAFG